MVFQQLNNNLKVKAPSNLYGFCCVQGDEEVSDCSEDESEVGGAIVQPATPSNSSAAQSENGDDSELTTASVSYSQTSSVSTGVSTPVQSTQSETCISKVNQSSVNKDASEHCRVSQSCGDMGPGNQLESSRANVVLLVKPTAVHTSQSESAVNRESRNTRKASRQSNSATL